MGFAERALLTSQIPLSYAVLMVGGFALASQPAHIVFLRKIALANHAHALVQLLVVYIAVNANIPGRLPQDPQLADHCQYQTLQH